MTRFREWIGRNPYLPMAVCCFLVVALRAWRRLGHMEIWAEDGTLYAPEALALGLPSLLRIYGGFFQLIPRALMLALVRLLPMTWLAAAVNLTSMLIVAAVAAMPIRRGYAWIIRDTPARFALCLLFCLAPGLHEMLGNFANLPWLFFYYLLFLGLRDLETPISGWEFVLAIAAIASMGQALFLIPLLGWRVYEHLKSRRRAAQLADGTLLLLCVAWTALLWLARETQFFAVPRESPWRLLRVFAKTTADALLEGLFGDRAAIALSALSSPAPRAFAIVLALSLMGAGVLACWRRPEARAVFLVTGSVLMWPVVSWFARPGNLPPFTAALSDSFTAIRYAFPSAIVVSLLWMYLLHASRLTASWKTGLSIAMVLLAIGFGGPRFWIREQGRERRWQTLAPRIDAALRTGCPNPVSGAIYPEGWSFNYQNPSRPQC